MSNEKKDYMDRFKKAVSGLNAADYKLLLGQKHNDMSLGACISAAKKSLDTSWGSRNIPLSSLK